MAMINIQPDCGNSPRKTFLKEIYTSLANGDIEILKANTQENIKWQVVGQFQVSDKKAYIKALGMYKLLNVKELMIETIITHGSDASVSGQFKMYDDLKYAFCDIYRFSGAGKTTIISITTFHVLQN